MMEGLKDHLVRAHYPPTYDFCQVHRLLSIYDRTGQFSPTKLKRKPASNHFDGRWIKQVICRCMGGLATLTAPDNRDAETTADTFNHDGQLQSI